VTSRIHTLAVLLVTALSGAGCVTSRAQIPEPPPALVVPPVPPRAIEPPVIVEPSVEPPPVEPLPAPVATSKPPRPRPAADKPEPKQEPPPDSGATVPTPPPVAPLRSAATPSGPDVPRQIREILETTQKMLDKVDPGTLEKSDDRKGNFEQAKAFLRQADEALKKEDLTLARSFAERAQNIAKLLQSGR
jgi:outer membrane biosynthesis protein TonB